MRVRIGMIGVVLCLSLIAAGDDRPAYPNSRKGFEKQFDEIYKAFKKGDEQRFRAALESFAMPAQWFADTFSPDEGAALAQVYAEQFYQFGHRTVFALKFFDAQAPTSLEVNEAHGDRKLNPPPAPPPPTLKPLPEVHWFVIAYSLQRGYVMEFGRKVSRTSWMDLFVYVDGAFRYFGSGAYPFYSPLRMYPSNPCYKAGDPKGGEVLERVEPAYPDEAKAKRIAGPVVAYVLIAADGSAKEVSNMKGNPALFEAAKQAMLQWKFRPFMNCGKPVEGRTLQRVEFALPK